MANSHMTFGVDLLPKTTNTYSLGNSNQKWKIYVNSINDVSDLHFTDTTYSAGTGISLSGTTFSNSGVTGVKGNAESSYRTGQVNLTAANINAITKNEVGNTQQLLRPTSLNGINDVTIQSLINDARANRLAFLPADQIIIEKTTDGGITWVDAGITNSVKAGLFSEKRSGVNIPQIDGQINILCGLRITITAMKYNVPENTAETEKYNYWNSNYVNTTERYCQLKNMYFWVSAATNTISVKVERATGANSTNWVSCFSKDNYGMTGWSGNDFISFNQNTFGGGKNQTGNYWNYRITLMSRGPSGSETLNNSSITSVQNISEIRGYGDTWWIKPNEYMASDHMYTWDYHKNVTFPARVTATSFSGSDASLTDLNASNITFQVVRAPTASGETTYGPGTSGQVLKSNGTSVYWATPDAAAANKLLSFSITTSNWTSSAGSYVYTISDSFVTENTTAIVNMNNSYDFLLSNLQVITGSGTVTFSTETIPSNTISGVLVLQK